jgi:hypothetical protein
MYVVDTLLCIFTPLLQCTMPDFFFSMRWSLTSAAVTAAATLAWLPSSILSGDAPGSALEGLSCESPVM